MIFDAMNPRYLAPCDLILGAVLALLAAPALADLNPVEAAGRALAIDVAKGNCLACHAVSNKLVGPAYKDVAAKYKGQKDAEVTLIANIRKGGSGKWGQVPMPPQATLSDADAKALAKWILSQAR